MINTYIFKVNWYDDYTDTDELSYGTIGANSLEEATHQIGKRFPNTYRIEIQELFSNDGFTFLTKEEYEKQLEDNDEC